MTEHRSMKDLVAEPGTKIGHMLFEFLTPNVGYALSSAGADFAIIDMEHNGLGFESLATAIRYLHVASIPAIARIATRVPSDVSRACDVGADAIMVPMVSSVEEVENIAAAMKYHPEGRRGVALPPLERYGPMPMLDAFKEANRRLALIVQIENTAGVENADAIAAMDSVDCIWTGHADLSCSLGIPGDFECDTFRQAEEKIINAAKSNGKALGRLGQNVEGCLALSRLGYDMLAFSNDLKVWAGGVGNGIRAIRAGLN